jgi:23S rRNA pseudouridine955/2504/2580 synthase
MGLKRMFLHAARLDLPHPITGEPIALTLALPPELRQFVDQLDNSENRTGKQG